MRRDFCTNDSGQYGDVCSKTNLVLPINIDQSDYPYTSKPEPGHKIYPYLLRRLPVIWPNEGWAIYEILGGIQRKRFTNDIASLGEEEDTNQAGSLKSARISVKADDILM